MLSARLPGPGIATVRFGMSALLIGASLLKAQRVIEVTGYTDFDTLDAMIGGLSQY